MSPASRVAVLVSIYRAGRFIAHKLANLRAQTAFDACHVILLNCQDLDGESGPCREFARQNGNVTYVEYGRHVRLYDAWNDGIGIGPRTEYVTNANVDDVQHPECLQALVEALDSDREAGVAHGDYFVTGLPNQPWDAWPPPVIHGMIETMYPLGSAGPCPMWRRSLHDRCGLFPSYSVIGDARMWERWHANGVRFKRVPRYLASYYQEHGHNLETRIDPETGLTLRQLDIEAG